MHLDHRGGSASQLPGLGVHLGFLLGQELNTDQPLLPESAFHMKKTQENQVGATEHSEQLPVWLIIRFGACHDKHQRMHVDTWPQ